MEKKGVNLIAILAIALIIVVVGVALFFVLRNSHHKQNDGGTGVVDLGSVALNLNDIDQFSAFAKDGEYECHLGDDRSGGSIYGVPLLGKDAVVTYYFDKDGKTTDFQAFFYLNAQLTDEGILNVTELTTEELAQFVDDAISRFSSVFGCTPADELYLSNSDGTFTLAEEPSAYRSMTDNGSVLTYSIRDAKGYFWELTISARETVVSANISKYFDPEETKDYIANISLYEEE